MDRISTSTASTTKSASSSRHAQLRPCRATYDARLDIKASLEYIRKNYGEEKIYTIAHCMGSVAFSTGLLDGTIPTDWILGITCSQVFMNPVWSTVNLAKVLAGPIPLDKLYTMLSGHWFSAHPPAPSPSFAPPSTPRASPAPPKHSQSPPSLNQSSSSPSTSPLVQMPSLFRPMAQG